MKLIDALRVESSTRLAFVGSGGKTSAVMRLAEEWPSKALLAATAHIGKDQIKDIPEHIIWRTDQTDLPKPVTGTTIITGPGEDRNKLQGVSPILWDDLKNLADQEYLPMFMESDGSKTRPIKAPDTHEPAIPAWVNHVVVSVGLSAVGRELNDQNVHRPELFSALSGLKMGEPITLHSMMKMLVSPQGGLKNIPRLARKTVLFNQADTLEDISALPCIEHQLLEHYDAVVTAALRRPETEGAEFNPQNEVLQATERIAGIIMAAGNSRRMGTPKALLEWRGVPFVRICALQAIKADLQPVHIIAGQEFARIQEAVKDLPVQVIRNEEWNEGQSSSVRTGIKSLPRKVGGAVFLLVDQPQIPATLIRKLIAEHAASLSPVTLPESGGRRANPVLFDRITFHALAGLQGDIGGRMIFSQFAIRPIPWFDESILLDVDTPADYEKLMELS